MGVPYPLVFIPFDILTAEELNQLVENDVALAAGTALDAGAITTSTLAESAVTASKISSSTIVKIQMHRVSTSVTVNGFTKMTMNTITNQTVGGYSTATGVFTAPVAAYYDIDYTQHLNTGGGEETMAAIYLNGVISKEGNRARGPVAASSISARSVHAMLYLNVGNTIEFYAWSNGAVATFNDSSHSYASIAQRL